MKKYLVQIWKIEEPFTYQGQIQAVGYSQELHKGRLLFADFVCSDHWEKAAKIAKEMMTNDIKDFFEFDGFDEILLTVFVNNEDNKRAFYFAVSSYDNESPKKDIEEWAKFYDKKNDCVSAMKYFFYIKDESEAAQNRIASYKEDFFDFPVPANQLPII